ncbi:MAG: VOC family protein [Cypionkella sp.]
MTDIKIKRIFHCNLNVRNLDESVEFYTNVLGGHIVEPEFEAAGPLMEGDGLGTQAYGIDPTHELTARGIFIKFGDDEHGLVLDILEYLRPRPVESAHATQYNIGYNRIALQVEDLDAAYAALVARKVKFMTPPVEAGDAAQSPLKRRYCCFYDPDGFVIELCERRL